MVWWLHLSVADPCRAWTGGSIHSQGTWMGILRIRSSINGLKSKNAGNGSRDCHVAQYWHVRWWFNWEMSKKSVSRVPKDCSFWTWRFLIRFGVRLYHTSMDTDGHPSTFTASKWMLKLQKFVSTLLPQHVVEISTWYVHPYLRWLTSYTTTIEHNQQLHDKQTFSGINI